MISLKSKMTKTTWAGKITQQVRAPATKLSDWSSVPKIHTIEE